MNYSMIVYIIGWILAVEAALMVPSGVVAIIYGETVGWVFPRSRSAWPLAFP